MKQFRLRDIFFASLFFAVLLAWSLLDFQAPGYVGIFVSLLPLLVVTVVAAALIQNILLGLLSLLLFYVSVSLHAVYYSRAEWPDLLVSTFCALAIHVAVYLIAAWTAIKSR